MNLNKDNSTVGWNILKTAMLIWPITSLPFILYFGLNGDDPKTAFSKSLIASAATIAALVVQYFTNWIRKSSIPITISNI